MALPQKHRLRGARVFDRLYRRGLRYEAPSMVLRVTAADAALLPPRDRSGPPAPWRCGVVVSAKVSKRAVRRNRLRRLLHGHLMAHPPSCPTPCWLLFTLRPASLDLPPDRLLGECSHLLRKAGLIP